MSAACVEQTAHRVGAVARSAPMAHWSRGGLASRSSALSSTAREGVRLSACATVGGARQSSAEPKPEIALRAARRWAPEREREREQESHSAWKAPRSEAGEAVERRADASRVPFCARACACAEAVPAKHIAELMERTASALAFETLHDLTPLLETDELPPDLLRLRPDEFLLRWVNVKLRKTAIGRVGSISDLQGGTALLALLQAVAGEVLATNAESRIARGEQNLVTQASRGPIRLSRLACAMSLVRRCAHVERWRQDSGADSPRQQAALLAVGSGAGGRHGVGGGAGACMLAAGGHGRSDGALRMGVRAQLRRPYFHSVLQDHA